MEGKRLVILDLDGTTANTLPTILECYRLTSKKMGRPEPTHEELMAGLGGSLYYNLKRMFGLNESEIAEAVSIYRGYYVAMGDSMVKPFDGIIEAVEELRSEGYLIGIATLKYEEIAKQLIKDWKKEHLFDTFHGADYGNVLTKADLIGMCLDDTGCAPQDAVMIGDSPDDCRSARKRRVHFIAASYGYSLPKDLCIREMIPYVEKASEIPSKVASMFDRRSQPTILNPVSSPSASYLTFLESRTALMVAVLSPSPTFRN
jgi:phosphoglycolate phosphatase